MDWCGWQNGGKEDSGWFANPLGGGAIGEIFVKRFGEFRDGDPTFVSRIRIWKSGVKSTVNLVSHVHEHAKLWASISPLVEQLRQWNFHGLIANDLK